MSKSLNPGRTIVIPKASRIRREPPPVEKERFWRSREWEKRLAVVGVVLVALAVTLIWMGVSYITSGSDEPGLKVKVEIKDA